MSDIENGNIPNSRDKMLRLPFDSENSAKNKKRTKLENKDESQETLQPAEMKLIRFLMEMSSHDKRLQLRGTQGIRHLLCTESHPPVAECIKIGVIQKCIEFLNKEGRTNLKYEATWILTNISAGTAEQTKKVIELGAIGPLIESLQSDNIQLVTQSCWVLTNCMGDDVEIRDDLFTRGIIPILGNIIKLHKSEKDLLRTVAWCLATAFQGTRTRIYDENLLTAIPLLGSLSKMEDIETVACAFWALSSIILIPDEHEDSSLPGRIFEAVEERGLLPRLVDNIESENLDLVYPCMRSIGNIVSGPDEQTEKLVVLGVLSPLCKALTNEKTNIVKEAAWVLSNISAGTVKHINDVVNSGAVPLLLNVIYKNEFRAKKEAIWAIANITNGGNENHIISLYKCGAIKCFCYSLSISDWNTILVVFEGLENMLKAVKSVNNSYSKRFRSQIEEYGGFDKIFDLQHHENESVHKKAFRFIQQFY